MSQFSRKKYKCKKEDPGKYSPASFTLLHGKIREKVFLRFIDTHLRDNAVFSGHRQHRLTKGKSYLTNIISLRLGHPSSWPREASRLVVWDFSEVFDTVS